MEFSRETIIGKLAFRAFELHLLISGCTDESRKNNLQMRYLEIHSIAIAFGIDAEVSTVIHKLQHPGK